MNVIFDNIIFSLQRFGGISVVWNELLQRAQADKELNLTELDDRNERLYAVQTDGAVSYSRLHGREAIGVPLVVFSRVAASGGT